jgi:hypothetical protein
MASAKCLCVAGSDRRRKSPHYFHTKAVIFTVLLR